MLEFASTPGGGAAWYGTQGADTVIADQLPGFTFDNLITTFGGNDYIEAGRGDDIVFAGKGDDIVFGGSGNDLIFGEDGNDFLVGGTGNDVVFGGKGNDFIDGGEGADRLFGGDGNDIILGGSGNDVIEGGRGNDLVDAGSGNDIVAGGDGADTIFGGTGDDKLSGQGGHDLIFGGSGNDLIIGGQGHDTLAGGSGEDVFYFASGFGKDVVLDFTPGADMLEIAANINGLTLTTPAQLHGREPVLEQARLLRFLVETCGPIFRVVRHPGFAHLVLRLAQAIAERQGAAAQAARPLTRPGTPALSLWQVPGAAGPGVWHLLSASGAERIAAPLRGCWASTSQPRVLRPVCSASSPGRTSPLPAWVGCPAAGASRGRTGSR